LTADGVYPHEPENRPQAAQWCAGQLQIQSHDIGSQRFIQTHRQGYGWRFSGLPHYDFTGAPSWVIPYYYAIFPGFEIFSNFI